MNYKLIGAKENETPEETIIRCANNLVKALIAGGYSLHSTSGVSGVAVDFYSRRPNKINIHNILAGWRIEGRCPIRISFKPPEEDLVPNE